MPLFLLVAVQSVSAADSAYLGFLGKHVVVEGTPPAWRPLQWIRPYETAVPGPVTGSDLRCGQEQDDRLVLCLQSKTGGLEPGAGRQLRKFATRPLTATVATAHAEALLREQLRGTPADLPSLLIQRQRDRVCGTDCQRRIILERPAK